MVALLLGLAMPLMAAAPVGAAPASSSHTWWVAVGGQTKGAAIQTMTFGPEKITIDNGDTVDFYANAEEVHTVTFTPGNKTPAYPFNPAESSAFTKGTSATYTWSLYNGKQKGISSDLLSTFNFGGAVIYGFPITTSYKVTFNLKGLKSPVTIPYFCLVHPGMMGWITVQPTGWKYPHTQGYYTWQAHQLIEQQIAKGFGVWYSERQSATNHMVWVGGSRDMADLMVFVNSTQRIDEGQSITFKNNSMGPHTVSFGKESTTCAPDLGPQCDVGTTPGATTATYKGGTFNVWLNPGQSITIKFQVKDGTYNYYCALHDYMGMVGKVVVY